MSPMTFLEDILGVLEKADRPVLQEIRGGDFVAVTGPQLLAQVAQARAALRKLRLKKGERCALLAHNSIQWVAMDLAIMAEGLIVVPLYARQSPAELVAMMKDCWPSAICCGDQALSDSIGKLWSDGPPHIRMDDVFERDAAAQRTPVVHMSGHDPVTIIYTSGTSGDAKGVVLNTGNVGHMLSCTSSRLDSLMHSSSRQDRVYHYLPFCFAGSWILLLTALKLGSLLSLNTDLTKIANEMRMVAPDYFLNVPALLERMRKAVDEQLWQTGGLPLLIYGKAKGAWVRQLEKKAVFVDKVWLATARAVVFPAIRKKMIGPKLKALICGSAPLAIDTQLYFMMLGVPVLQVYGLTETTAICTMDDPNHVTSGRVGPAISGIEMKLAENEEIVVRGPNIFPGYWDRQQENAKVLRDGWFHTGDQGEVDANGNWRIIGRIKNLIILGSGHNIAPEPIEERILQELPTASQAVLVGNGRGYLSAIITGKIDRAQARAAIDAVNRTLPHYKQVRQFVLREDPFSVENGFLTANGKLKRDVISSRMKNEIEEMYRAKQEVG